MACRFPEEEEVKDAHVEEDAGEEKENTVRQGIRHFRASPAYRPLPRAFSMALSMTLLKQVATLPPTLVSDFLRREFRADWRSFRGFRLICRRLERQP